MIEPHQQIELSALANDPTRQPLADAIKTVFEDETQRYTQDAAQHVLAERHHEATIAAAKADAYRKAWTRIEQAAKQE